MRGFDDYEQTKKITMNHVWSFQREWNFPGSMSLQFDGAYLMKYESNERIAVNNQFGRLEFYYATGKDACQNEQGLQTIRDQALKSEQTGAPEDTIRYCR